MEMEVTMKIDAILNALNTIEVKGERNLDGLLACIQTLKQIRAIINSPRTDGGEAPNG